MYVHIRLGREREDNFSMGYTGYMEYIRVSYICIN